MVRGARCDRRRTPDRENASAERAGPGGVCVRDDVRVHRLDYVAGTALVLDGIRGDVPDRRSTGIVRVCDRLGHRTFGTIAAQGLCDQTAFTRSWESHVRFHGA